MTSIPRRVSVQQDFQKIPLLGMVVEQAASAPGTPANGQLYYDTVLNRIQARENGAWVNASQTGSELLANKNANNGYAGLNGSGVVALAQLSGITDAQIAAANKDGVAGTASLRTLGTGAQQALGGTTRLDQIAVPTASVSLNSQKITNLLDPTSAQEAATRNYVDTAIAAMASGLDIKASVRAASTANIAGATYNNTGGTSGRGQLTTMPNTLDGVTLAAGNRVLLKDQTTGAQNGIWVVSTLGTGANGVWDRATDFDTDAEVTSGAFTFVEEGTTNDNSGWVLQTNNPIIIGGASGTALVWGQFSGAGTITAGNGLTKVGSQISAVGTANRISVSGSGIDIDAAYVGQTSINTVGTITTGTWSGTAIAVAKGGTGATDAPTARSNLSAAGVYEQDIGAITAGTEVIITHNLGRKRIHVSVSRTSDDTEETVSVRFASTTTVGITTDISYLTGALHIVCIG